MSERDELARLRDHFAAAALTGLLVNANSDIDEETMDTPSDIAYTAYAMADAMLRERERTNHDAAPAARAAPSESSVPLGEGHGTGDTPVTEPMPKKNRAEVSDGWRSDIRPPDAADRAAAAACDEAWGITAEPVAWGVMDGHEFMEFCTDKEDAKCASGFYGDCPIVPLYRQPTLTDAEREAVEWAAQHIDNCGWSSATLRGLLDRTRTVEMDS